MKRALIALPILVLFAIGLGFAVLWLYMHGPARTGAPVLSDRQPLPPFHALDVTGVADVALVQGPGESLSLDMSDRDRSRLRVRVEDGVLRIVSTSRPRWWDRFFGSSSRPPRLRIEFKTLDAVSGSGGLKLSAEQLKTDRLQVNVSGAATLKIDALDTDQLTIDGSGAIKADLAGRARRQSIQISGAGDYRAADLASEQADVDVSGAGRVIVNASRTLDISLSGAGTVEYVGDPEVKQTVSGVGRIKRRQAHDGSDRTDLIARAVSEAGRVPQAASPA